MKILLFGDYSNLHWTLKEGLNQIGQKNVIVASHGDSWKNYNRDINLKAGNSKGAIKKIASNFLRFANYDVVQIINPLFAFSGSKSLFLNKWVFNYLRFVNKRIYLSAVGTDYFWTNACLNNCFSYDPINANINQPDFKQIAKDALGYLNKDVKILNHRFAQQSVKIISSTYSYYTGYKNSSFSEKLEFVPFPINIDKIYPKYSTKTDKQSLINFFVGVQKKRDKWKGTSTVLNILKEFENKFPLEIKITVVESLPYDQYLKLMNKSDIVVDQLYSYSPGMNALTAMAQGKIVMSGGEPEMYKMLGEKENFPIINIKPDKQQISRQIEMLLDKKSEISEMKYNSRKFIETHHDYKKIAEKYIEIWGNRK